MFNRKNIIGITLIISALFVFVGLGAIQPLLNNFQTRSYGTPVLQKAPNFKLWNTKGEITTLEHFKGRYVYLFFGYGHCKVVCPTHLHAMGEMMRQLGSPTQVELLFITLDPNRDTPKFLQEYTRFYHPKMQGLYTPDHRVVRHLAQQYSCSYTQTNTQEGYEINHTAFIYLIDPEGVLHYLYTSNTPDPEKMAEDFQNLLHDPK